VKDVSLNPLPVKRVRDVECKQSSKLRSAAHVRSAQYGYGCCEYATDRLSIAANREACRESSGIKVLREGDLRGRSTGRRGGGRGCEVPWQGLHLLSTSCHLLHISRKCNAVNFDHLPLSLSVRLHLSHLRAPAASVNDRRTHLRPEQLPNQSCVRRTDASVDDRSDRWLTLTPWLQSRKSRCLMSMYIAEVMGTGIQ
jgi:hypothetical protein